jgi:hypothetical protein
MGEDKKAVAITTGIKITALSRLEAAPFSYPSVGIYSSVGM